MTFASVLSDSRRGVASVLALVGAQFIELRRSRTAIFWMTAFPLGFLLLFGYVMARGDARVMAVMMPGLLTTTLMSGALFGVALPLVQQRETGLLRRLRVTPVPAASVAIAHGITAFITGFFSLVVLMLLGGFLFDMKMAGTWLALSGVYACGACALVPMGLLVGSTARDIRTAPAISNLLFFPLMFLSGSAMPFAVLPDGVKRFARLLPTTYLVDTYSGVIVRGEGLVALAGSLAVLVGVGVVGIVLTSMLFRWEGTDPIPRKSLATIALAFATTLGVSAAAAPAFRMGELPGTRRIDAGGAQRPGAGVARRHGPRRARRPDRQRPCRHTRSSHRGRIARRRSRADAGRRRGRGSARAIPDSGPLRFARALGRVGWSRGGADGADRRSPGARLRRGAGRRRHLGGVAHRQSRRHAVAFAAGRGGEASAPRARSSPGRRSPRRGGHPAEMFAFLPGLAEQLTRQVETPEAARAAIAELDRAGVDLVKLVLEPGFEDRPLPRLDEDVFRAAMAEARSRKMRTTVHVGTDADARLAIDAGANGLEHAARGLSDDDHRDDGGQAGHVHADQRRARLGMEAAARFEARTIACGRWRCRRSSRRCWTRRLRSRRCSSTVPLSDAMAQAFAGSLDQTARAIRAGVPILAGSDAGNPVTFHGVSLIRELELLAQAGMPLGDVLKSATSRAADRLGQSTLGRVTTGAIADLVVLDADPTEQVAAYRGVVSVYLGGRKLDVAHLTDTSPGPWRPGVR